jgi:RNase P/RNase MRP subunit POP5
MQRLRYLVCQVEWGAPLGREDDAVDPSAATASDLFAALRASVQEVLGDAGYAAVAPALAVRFFSPASRLAVVRAPAEHAARVRAALTLLRAVRRRAAAVHVVQVASTARALREGLRRWSGSVAGALRDAGAEEALLAALGEEAAAAAAAV